MRLEIIFGLLVLCLGACAPNFHYVDPPCTTQANCEQAEDIQIGRMWAHAQRALEAETAGTSYSISPDTWSFEQIRSSDFGCGGQPAWGCIDVNTRHIQWVQARPMSLSHECMHAILYDLQRKDWGTSLDGVAEEEEQ
jgi:hypothetical protein